MKANLSRQDRSHPNSPWPNQMNSQINFNKFRPHLAAIDDGFKQFGFRPLIERVLYNDTVTRKKSSQANTLEPNTLSYRNTIQKIDATL